MRQPRVRLALLSRCFDWPSALVVVRPESAAQSQSEFHLRTRHRDDSQGVLGLAHSAF
jgi:hypothetical protein